MRKESNGDKKIRERNKENTKIKSKWRKSREKRERLLYYYCYYYYPFSY